MPPMASSHRIRNLRQQIYQASMLDTTLISANLDTFSYENVSFPRECFDYVKHQTNVL